MTDIINDNTDLQESVNLNGTDDTQAENKQTFEKDLSELESVVAALEKSDISLDDMLKLFERGIKLTRSCTSALDKAEQKITVLMRNRETGELSEQPFAPMAD